MLWRNVRGKTLLSKAARDYKKAVLTMCFDRRALKPKVLTGRLSVEIRAYPPTKRPFDIDNRVKIVLDSLQEAFIFVNDNQVDKLYIERMGVITGGYLDVTIQEIDE